jgi:isopentenyl phosphate kinase
MRGAARPSSPPRRATAVAALASAPADNRPPAPPPRLACLVKLGGALITDKSRDVEALRPEALRETARHLALAYKQSSNGGSEGSGSSSRGVVVVHGAGSFGHPPARRYGVARGGDLRSDPFLREGVCETRLRVSRLHGLVLEALLEAGVPAAGLPPFAGGWGPTHGPGRVSPSRAADACGRVRACLDAGLVPVLYGDVVLDATQGCAVLSGDAIMRELAKALRPERAVFLTDVDGVFDRPPEEAGARLVRVARLGGGGGGEDDEWVLEGSGGSNGGNGGGVRLGGAREGAADVSGGMEAKVEEAAAISREAGGAPVIVAKGGTESALQALLRGADAFSLEGGGGGGGRALRGTVVMTRAERTRPRRFDC